MQAHFGAKPSGVVRDCARPWATRHVRVVLDTIFDCSRAAVSTVGAYDLLNWVWRPARWDCVCRLSQPAVPLLC